MASIWITDGLQWTGNASFFHVLADRALLSDNSHLRTLFAHALANDVLHVKVFWENKLVRDAFQLTLRKTIADLAAGKTSLVDTQYRQAIEMFTSLMEEFTVLIEEYQEAETRPTRWRWQKRIFRYYQPSCVAMPFFFFWLRYPSRRKWPGWIYWPAQFLKAFWPLPVGLGFLYYLYRKNAGG